MPASSPVIVVNNVWSRISGVRDLHLIDRLDHALSYAVEGAQFTRAYKHGFWDKKSGQMRFWDGRRHLLNQSMVFPTGLLQRVLSFFESAGVDIEIDDRREKVECGEPLEVKKFSPRPYQKKALEKALESGRGIIRAGTGSGKTLIVAMLAAHYNVPTVVYVIGRDLLYQFHREFSEILGCDVGIVGDGQCDIRKINICSVWTAAKSFGMSGKISFDDEDWNPDISDLPSDRKRLVKSMVENANLVLFDEAHFLGADSLQSIFKASKRARFIFGASATPWREDGADLLLESVCGPVVFNISSSELIRQKWLVRPDIVMMRPPRLEISSKNYKSVYSQAVTRNEERNAMIEQSVRMLVSKKRKPLVLVRHLSHGRDVEKRLMDINAHFVCGDTDSEARKRLVEGFVSGHIGCLVASSVFDVGVDIPEIDALVMAAGGKSASRTLQRIGRVLRIFSSKTNAIVVDFIDEVRYLKKHSAIRCAAYMSEPAFNVKFAHGLPPGFKNMVSHYKERFHG